MQNTNVLAQEFKTTMTLLIGWKKKNSIQKSNEFLWRRELGQLEVEVPFVEALEG